MPLHITENRPASPQEWESAARSCVYATFFHTPQWVTLFEQGYGVRRFRGCGRAVKFSDGARVVLPLARWRRARGLVSVDFSCLAGTYGGWITADPLTQEHARLLTGVLSERGNLIWRENPYDPLAGAYAMPGSTDDFTQAVHLGGMTGDDILKDADYAHRKAVKKAHAAGISVRCATSADDWRHHFQAYQISQKRWQRHRLRVGDRYPWRLFDAMRRAESPHMRLWIAERGGEYLAGVIAFYWNRHGVAWHGAAFDEYMHLRPNNLLYAEMIRDAAQQGYDWFDCNPGGGYEGVTKFKEHLGAQRLSSRVMLRSSGLRSVGRWLRKLGLR